MLPVTSSQDVRTDFNTQPVKRCAQFAKPENTILEPTWTSSLRQKSSYGKTIACKPIIIIVAAQGWPKPDYF